MQTTGASAHPTGDRTKTGNEQHEVPEAEALAVAHALLRGQEHILRHIRDPFWPPDAVPLPHNVRYGADVRTVRATLRAAEAQINLRPRGGMTLRLAPTDATPRHAG